ncbi:MAG: hypothetical protein A3J06_03145 [Candidatus Moranbacteria bacterium RIFCSPLOWO2_02_FULL_48_19]|nr:MAG: hypothetical protein A3J06_03145 [Candidatus Moranbacteria bacterium RIFCSPLOWO2_02_FULL_48_19]OGI29924.1 MAG: hypothetical protein A3G09_04905 [Candidatus Moranbacteria bacterium RIFCSPLOWO2_12_FULL_48_12]
MAKVKIHSISKAERKCIVENFLEMIFRLKKKQQIIDVLLRLMTPSEALMFARRIQVAQALLQNVETQETLRRRLKVGFRTMEKIEEWLHTGDAARDSWLAKELLRLPNQRQETVSRAKRKRSPLDRYPEHRLMKEIFRSLFE